MSTHHDQFREFIALIGGLRYAIIRGHHTLPETPEGDIDIVVHPDDAEDMFRAASEVLQLEREENHGFAVYARMMNKAYCTVGPEDLEVTHGKFCVDIASPIFFKSPLKNYTTYWPVPKHYVEEVLRDRITYEVCGNGVPVYFPTLVDEVVLQVLRNTFDLQGEWREKSKRVVMELLPRISRGRLGVALKSAGVPNADLVIDMLLDGEFGMVKRAMCL